MKKVIKQVLKMSSALALSMTAMNVDTMCSCTYHQPEMPACAKKLKK